MAALKKLCAVEIACKSPVKWRLIFSLGIICAKPPPVAPPFIPKTGPKEGSLKQPIVLFPIRFNPSVNPIEIVVLPSPNGVGVIALTKTSLPSTLSFNLS